MWQKYIIHKSIEKMMKTTMIKNCYHVRHIQVILKIMKNIRNIVEVAVKVEKSNWNGLHSRCKPIDYTNSS